MANANVLRLAAAERTLATAEHHLDQSRREMEIFVAALDAALEAQLDPHRVAMFEAHVVAARAAYMGAADVRDDLIAERNKARRAVDVEASCRELAANRAGFNELPRLD